MLAIEAEFHTEGPSILIGTPSVQDERKRDRTCILYRQTEKNVHASPIVLLNYRFIIPYSLFRGSRQSSVGNAAEGQKLNTCID